MSLELKQHLKMTQQLVMTPQLQQAIKLLQLSRMELVDLVRTDMNENPLLDGADDGEDPTVPIPLNAFNASALSFTKRGGTSGLTYAILESTDLGNADDWTEVSGGLYVNDPTTISYTLTPGTPPNNFIRL